MINKIIIDIQKKLKDDFDSKQLSILSDVLARELEKYEITIKNNECRVNDNKTLIESFISAKKIEGCSNKTLDYYSKTIYQTVEMIGKPIIAIKTEDLRIYLSNFQEQRKSSKVTIDNIRRILSSFFAWLEDEDLIIKSPVRRIHKVKFGKVVKETLTDEELEKLRDNCKTTRDLAMIELLSSTGMRVGELVNLNIEDIDFNERECIVFGKGDSEREVYFDAKTKLHLIRYLEMRDDENNALFVSLKGNHERLKINGVEAAIKKLGNRTGIKNVHPHKFRRTMATNAINKGMPIEQVQKLLGHVRIDTTLHYAMVNQNNVKISHRRYIA